MGGGVSAIPSTVDPAALLQELGIQVQQEKGDEIWARCPGHIKRVGHVDHDASWSVNVETGEHHCFSCGYGGTIWWLIAVTMEWYDGDEPDLKRAQKWLQRRGGDSMDVAKRLRSTAEAFVRPIKRKAMDESRLALFTDAPDWATNARRVSDDSLDHFGVRWNDDYQAWILPIRDPSNGRLWGWQLKGEDPDARIFRNHPTGVKKSEALFGYEKFTGGAVVLVESPLDAVRLHTCGYQALSTYGAVWTDTQLSLVCAKADSLIAAFDNDDPGYKASMLLMGRDKTGKRIKGAKDWTTRIDTRFFDYDHAPLKDPGEMSASQIRAGVEHARSSIHGAKALA